MDASPNLMKVHDRMPVFLNQETKSMWLDPQKTFAECFKAIMKSKVYEGLNFYEVGELVNSIKHDKPEVIMPKEEYEKMTY